MKISIFVVSFVFLTTNFAHAQQSRRSEGSTLLGGYSLGVELAPSLNLHVIEYEDTDQSLSPRACEMKDGRNECLNVMTPNKINSFGVFVTKQYVPDGFFTFDYGFDLSFRRYQASLVSDPTITVEQDGKKINLADEFGPEQNLQEMELDAYNLATRFFIKYGITPPILPDLLFSTGVGIESIYGTLRINGEDFSELAFAPHIFVQMELVWARFLGRGSFSTYLDMQLNQASDAGRQRNIEKDGMENFRINTASLTFGVARLVFPM
jgi:hypothetical protein